MKFSINSSPGKIKQLYTITALIVLFTCLVNFYLQMFSNITGNDQCRWIDKDKSKLLITDIVSRGVTEQAGVQDGDLLVKIDGQPFEKSFDAQAMINKLAGSYATYTIERNGKQFETKVLILKSINLSFLAQFFYGLGFLLVGYVVVMVKPQGKMQRMFGRFSILSMLFFGLSALNLNPQTNPFWQRILLSSGLIVGSIFAPPTFVRFFLLFPARRSGFQRRWITILLYTLSILLTIIIFIGNRFDIRLPAIAFFTRYGFYVAGFIVFVVSYFKFVARERRPELRPILIGVAIGLVMFSYSLAVNAINPFAAFLNPTILFPVMLLIVVPIFFGYAIFRFGLMDVDLVVRRSLIYGAVTAIVASVYLVIIYGLGNLLSWFFTVEGNRIFQVVSLVLIAIAFDPLKQRLQVAIDKIFYRERYDYQKALLEFTQELPRLMELEHISDSLLNRISTTMHIERVAVIICGDQEGCKSVAKNIDVNDCIFSMKDKSLMQILLTTHKPVDLHTLAEGFDTIEIYEEEKQKLIRSGIMLSIPMFLKERLIGFINVGSKMSGKVFSQEDINLLSTVAGQAAIAIENSRLHKAEIEQQRIKEELELARKIQQGLFPKKNPEMNGLAVAGVSLPASSVGGDYYDFIQLNPTKLVTVVADVSGKGMSAALYMSKIQGMVQLASRMYESPKEMLININRRIFEGIDRKSFITMILALFDLEKNEVRICRAGHNKALISTNGSFQFLSGGGIALGLEYGPKFEDAIEEIKIQLKPDSLFLFYTDGITEAMNEGKEQFGEENVVRILENYRSSLPNEIEKEILKSLEVHRGNAEQHDDITMIVVKKEKN